MPKLVILNASLAGRSQELAVDKTTIGRVEDNTFPIADPSVSSHHCEVLLRGNDVVVKDLNSTNGTFINGDQISEAVLKPGQTLRLGQIELRLETEGMAPAPAPASASSSAAPAPASAASSSKKMDHTMVMQRGVSLNELEGPRSGGFDTTSKAFSKKDNQTNRWFWIGGIIAAVLIALLMLYAFSQIRR
ncbi:MAG TPA: FHA domain-containing protein [Verrucomicrobiae bacterium]|jgi:pSer/pThr/pTyr-binding forkhead associated (FHA) protein|nr:FHA domain-containing protein [Verrucomicrobiae bacterium]